MPGRFLTDAQRYRLTHFPTDVSTEDISIYFTLTSEDKAQVQQQRTSHNRLGFALQMGALRFMGFCPDDLKEAPNAIVKYLAQQLEVSENVLADYGARTQTRTEHFLKVQHYLGFRSAEESDLCILTDWLVQRALEHDKPTLLFQLGAEKLYREKIVRPGVTILERMVVSARQKAHEVTYTELAPLLSEDVVSTLNGLLVPDKVTSRTRLSWLRRKAITNSPNSIKTAIEKISLLREWGVSQWDLSSINPNRCRFLAQLGCKSTNQALQRITPERRYPILIAFLHQMLSEIIDETMDIFSDCLSDADRRSRRDLDNLRVALAKSTNEKLRLFSELGTIVLDSAIPEDKVRAHIYEQVPKEQLEAEVAECSLMVRPHATSAVDFFVGRYNYFRQFAPILFSTFTFHSNQEYAPLLEGVSLIKRLNEQGKRKIPLDEDVPLDFVGATWQPYVIQSDGTIDRHAYESCVLWELRNALRAGNVWLEGSRRYADSESYLIPRDRWPDLRNEVCQLIGAEENGQQRLSQRQEELKKHLASFDKSFPQNSAVRMENDELIVSPLEAEKLPERVGLLQKVIGECLPRVDLAELLIEVDSWTQFTNRFEHPASNEPKTKELRIYLYASILAQACNLGLAEVAQMSDLSYQQLLWCTNWYLREETLRPAMAEIVNYHHHLPLSFLWGDGTMSSSDGQRFPVSGKVRNAVALPRYFGYGRGLTFYSWTSNQCNQYGTKVIPSTSRDSTYVLDEILDNETELPILEHTTDTDGYTEIMFALFDLLGLKFSPRISDIGSQSLYRIDKSITYQHIETLLKGRINVERILKQWDNMLRAAGSLKLGWVTASLFISRLLSYPQKNVLAKALQEYGRLIKTIFILRYLGSEEYRRRINTQINKGEGLHRIRKFLMFGDEGKIRKKQLEEQTNQASCLTLVTNAIITWNTVYMAGAIDQLRAQGYEISDEDITHLSPARRKHINRYGKYQFNISDVLNRKQLRPLRNPSSS